MSDAILTLALVLSGILLAYTTYAAIYGLAGAFTGRSYERCPNCHGHYLADKSGTALAHECSTGWGYQLLHPFHAVASRVHSMASRTHHAHPGRG